MPHPTQYRLFWRRKKKFVNVHLVASRETEVSLKCWHSRFIPPMSLELVCVFENLS